MTFNITSTAVSVNKKALKHRNLISGRRQVHTVIRFVQSGYISLHSERMSNEKRWGGEAGEGNVDR